MRYSDDVIMDIRLGCDIVDVIGDYVKLTRRGSNYFGLCPFHNEKTPSFSVSPEKQIYRCFGCGAGGGVFKFIQEKENMTFPEAVEFLANRIHYKLPERTDSKADEGKRELREKLWEVHKAAARFYYACLNSEAGNGARAYLDKRGVSMQIRKKFGLGYSPDNWDRLNKYLLESGFEEDIILKSGLVKEGSSGKFYDRFRNRVMFPIIDLHGHIIAFGGRTIGDDPAKYLNSPETEIYKKSFNPYNLNFARQTNEKYLILVEGYMDAISLYQAGFRNVIASCGTAVNDAHASIIKRMKKGVILLLDSDDAGENAVLRAISVLNRAGIDSKVLQVTDAKDPDEYIQKFGAEAFAKLLKNAVNQIIFRINVLKKRFSLDDPDGRISFTNEVVNILSEIDSNIELEIYINEIARDVKISPQALKAEVERIKGREVPNSAGAVSSNVKNVEVNNSLEAAKAGIIEILAGDKELFEHSKQFFDKKELNDDFYIRLYDIVEKLHSQNKQVLEADVITLLGPDNTQEQAKAAKIFMQQIPYDDYRAKKKALHDMILEAKKAYNNDQIVNQSDPIILMELIDKARNLDKELEKF